MSNTFRYKKIGNFIKKIRLNKGFSQKDLAAKLGTTQSVIARIERGEQNLSTETLNKFSSVFGEPVVKFANNEMDFIIEGGNKLHGEIETNTSKNGAMGLLSASMLNKGKTTLHGIPRIEEVNRILEVMTSIGYEVKWIGEQSLTIKYSGKINLKNINAASARKTRSVIMFAAPLAHLFDKFSLPNAGGCNLGKRTISPHINALEKMGLKFEVTESEYIITKDKLVPARVVMSEASDTATENAIMLASKIPGKTLIRFAGANYMVQDVCFFLQKLGVKINGVGTGFLEIEGVEEINEDIEFYNSEDPIESMLFITAAIVTDSKLTIKRAPIQFLELELEKLRLMGLKFKLSKSYKSRNECTELVDITVCPSELVRSEDKIHPLPYPGINMDNLPFFVAIAAKAKGETLIHDWVYENRAIYYMELEKLGVDIKFADIHRVYVKGGQPLKGAQIIAPKAIRPAVIILLMMLATNGMSILRDVYFINRAYEDIATRLNKVGAKIRVVNEMV